ncbi:MAG: hypothetical protein H7Y89_14360 [Steroidobacteraceae bacterium]|nr:hypothetical protein [Steroidobacteraceae bacterium]
MTPLESLLTAIAIALGASTITILAIFRPLRRQLAAMCPVDTTAAFWMRSAVAVIYLLPLFMVVAFGVPVLGPKEFTTAEIVRRTLAASAFTLVTIVMAIGFRLASLRPASADDYPPAVR